MNAPQSPAAMRSVQRGLRMQGTLCEPGSGRCATLVPVRTTVVRAARRTRFVLLAAVCMIIAMLSVPATAAEHAAPTLAGKAGSDAKVQQLLDLLADPDIRQVLSRQRPAGETPAPEPAVGDTMSATLGDQLQGFRNHLSALVMSVGDFPSQASMAHAMALDALQQRGLVSTGLALAAFVILGFGAQYLFHLMGRPFRHWLFDLKLDTVEERLQAVFARLIYGLGMVMSYALGSVGAFLLFDWPVLIKTVLLGFLIAFLIVRFSTVVGRFLLAPGAMRFRVVPVSTPVAWYLYARLLAFSILVSFGWQAIVILGRFGFSPLAQELSSDALGFVALCLGVVTLLRLPALSVIEDGQVERSRRQRVLALVLSGLFAVLWLLWVVRAAQAFWLLAFTLGLPIVIVTARASVSHILRPVGAVVADDEGKSFHAVVFERGVRSLIIISAALLLAWIFDIDIVSLTMRDTIGTRLLRGLISVVVIALVADFLWTLIRAIINRKLQQALPHQSAAPDLGHAARLQTLLPIISNILLATIVIVAGMMMLGALGVQIGPLIASAGVVGVAIGFGAQTLVKDVISGIFYLVDDAFRIGEYIQSGNYKGTVESFSLRSVKLRHQRGALYTVPFGVLGAVQNQSRDWVVDKILMNVPYGTDLEKVRKLIKRVGETLTEDPDHGQEIISPLKMQGVSQFGDYAIQIQTKMMTKPGDAQFMMRRKALLMIKRSFEDNGIGFAMPTVQVSGEGQVAAAAAKSLSLVATTKAG